MSNVSFSNAHIVVDQLSINDCDAHFIQLMIRLSIIARFPRWTVVYSPRIGIMYLVIWKCKMPLPEKGVYQKHVLVYETITASYKVKYNQAAMTSSRRGISSPGQNEQK